MAPVRVQCLRFHECGSPREVLRLDTVELDDDLHPEQVLVKYEAATILMAHLNVIENTYPIKVKPPAIPGNEAVGYVVKAGDAVPKLKVGDRVLPLNSRGAWSELEVLKADECFKVDPSLDLETAVSFLSNPITAWKMLQTYVRLERGDIVVQNLANSHCGQCVIQLAKVFGYTTVNVVRDRPNIDELKNELKTMGADHVFTEEEFGKVSRRFAKQFGDAPKLALNGTGGKSSAALAGCLAMNGVMLVYGGMSKKPHQIPTGALVFKNIRVLGVPAGYYLRPENQTERMDYLNKLHDLAVQKKLRGPFMERVPLNRYQQAIARTMEGKNAKQLLVFDHNQSKL